MIWIPSLVGLGAWLGESAPLAAYLHSTLQSTLDAEPFHFAKPLPGCLLRVLKNESSYVTILVNGGTRPAGCELTVPSDLHLTTLWGASGSARTGIENLSCPLKQHWCSSGNDTMTHKVVLRSPTLPVLPPELCDWPNFARPILTQTYYEPQGNLNGKK